MDDSKEKLESLIAEHGIDGVKEILLSLGWTRFTDPAGAEVFQPPDGNGSITFNPPPSQGGPSDEA